MTVPIGLIASQHDKKKKRLIVLYDASQYSQEGLDTQNSIDVVFFLVGAQSQVLTRTSTTPLDIYSYM